MPAGANGLLSDFLRRDIPRRRDERANLEAPCHSPRHGHGFLGDSGRFTELDPGRRDSVPAHSLCFTPISTKESNAPSPSVQFMAPNARGLDLAFGVRR